MEAATFGMAELYRNLGSDLMTSERPKNLDADAKEQYDVLLEEQAFPFEEQAISTHEINTKRVRDNVYDEGVKQSFAALAELKPGRYVFVEPGSKRKILPGDEGLRMICVGSTPGAYEVRQG